MSLAALPLGFTFMAIVAMAADLATPVPAVVLAVLFYLLPAGVGLAVLPLGATMSGIGLRKAEHALLAYFVGLIMVTLIVVARERNTSPDMRQELFDPVVLDYLLVGLGAFGWARAVREWADLRGIDDFVRAAVWCSPLVVVPYTLTFLVFSRYPLTDLFQFTHIMKAAEEFAAFDRLNPFTADSYASVIQSLLGSLLRITGANSLDAVWLLPLPAYLLRVAVLYAVGRRVLGKYRSLTIFVAITLPFFGTGVLTNGDLAALGCLLVMALILATLQQHNASGRTTWGISIGVTAALAVALATSRLLPDWLMLCFVLLMVVAIPLAASRPGGVATFLAACLAIVAVAPLHRSTVLLIPAIAFSLAWMTRPLLGRHALAWLSVALAIIGATVSSSILMNEYGNFSFPDPGKTLTEWIDGVFGTRFSTSHDAMLGTGAKVALFEMARSVGPLIALWSLILAPQCLSRDREHRRLTGDFVIRADATWFTGCALIVLLLLGLPFAYRAVFIPMVLFAVLIARHFTCLDQRGLIHVTAGVTALSLLIAVGEYAVSEDSTTASYYIDRAMPAVLLCLLPMAGIGIVLIFRSRWLKPAAVLAVVWAVLFEHQVIRYHFFHYSFPGEPPPRTEPLSHYTLQDIKLAERIRDNYGDGILISDPYTLAIMRALTGLNSIVSFSNLDTMNTRAAEELRQYLQSILTGQEATGDHNCGEWHRAARLLSFGVSSESNYALFQTANPRTLGRDVLRAFGYRSGLLLSPQETSQDAPIAENRHAWLISSKVLGETRSTATPVRRNEREAKVITVINGRTIEWAFGLFAGQRHDGTDTLESGSPVHQMLVAQCSALIGPGNNMILVHPFGNE